MFSLLSDWLFNSIVSSLWMHCRYVSFVLNPLLQLISCILIMSWHRNTFRMSLCGWNKWWLLDSHNKDHHCRAWTFVVIVVCLNKLLAVRLLLNIFGMPCPSCFITVIGYMFKNAYQLSNLRALEIWILHRNSIFQYMGKIFCVEFQRYPLKFHTKYFTHTLKDVHFILRWKFKSS